MIRSSLGPTLAQEDLADAEPGHDGHVQGDGKGHWYVTALVCSDPAHAPTGEPHELIETVHTRSAASRSSAHCATWASGVETAWPTSPRRRLRAPTRIQ